jgi:deoxynucleoside triphosphate triphosphohydrolase SAMHD1
MMLQQELTPTLREEGWEFAKSIADAFRKASPGDSVVLCDDNATSGSQAECQFMAWFGIPRDQWAEDQKQEQGINDVELDDRDKELARQMNIAVAVCAGGGETASFRKGPNAGNRIFSRCFLPPGSNAAFCRTASAS